MEAEVKRITKDGFKVMKPYEPGKRFHWLSKVIRSKGYTIGAEIGCANGITTATILQNNPSLVLFAVDLWGIVPDGAGGGSQYRDWNFKQLRGRFDKAVSPYKHKVTVLQGISWEMADEVKDNSLDFIFIDADHEYASVIKDIKAWTPKLKSGGMISGHDTHFPEVLKAINELIPKWKAAGIDHCWFAEKEDVIC